MHCRRTSIAALAQQKPPAFRLSTKSGTRRARRQRHPSGQDRGGLRLSPADRVGRRSHAGDRAQAAGAAAARVAEAGNTGTAAPRAVWFVAIRWRRPRSRPARRAAALRCRYRIRCSSRCAPQRMTGIGRSNRVVRRRGLGADPEAAASANATQRPGDTRLNVGEPVDARRRADDRRPQLERPHRRRSPYRRGVRTLANASGGPFFLRFSRCSGRGPAFVNGNLRLEARQSSTTTSRSTSPRRRPSASAWAVRRLVGAADHGVGEGWHEQSSTRALACAGGG